MGNLKSHNTYSVLPINFKLLKQQKNTILGNIKHLLNTHDQNHYIMIERVFASSPDFEISLNRIKARCRISKLKRKYLPNDFILEIMDYRTIEQTQLCGKTYKIVIFIKSYERILKQIFLQRQKSNQSYSESELVYFMINIITCLIELYDHNIKPYHLSMESIVCKNNYYKIIDQELTNCMSPFDSLRYQAELTLGTFIAPELLTNSAQQISNATKCDIFTLGIIVLEMAQLKTLDQLYDFNNRRINFSKIETIIVKLNYSASFKNLLQQMLQEFPEQRIGLLRLKQMLQKISIPKLNEQASKNQNYRELELGFFNHQQTVYLGRNLNVKKTPNQNMQKFIASTFPKDRKNSYHRLLNDKIDYRNKQPVGFKNQIPQNPSQPIQNLQSQLFVNPVPIYTYTALATIPLKRIDNNQDISDNRSDAPISPISLQKRQDQFKSNLQFTTKNKPSLLSRPESQDYPQSKAKKSHLQTQNQSIQRPKNKQMNGIFDKQQFKKKTVKIHKDKSEPKNYDYNLLLKQTKLQSYYPNFDQKKSDKDVNQVKKLYPSVDFKISQFTEFSNIGKPVLQQLETPRIYKDIQRKLPGIQINLFSEKNQIPEETPIKSLEFIQTSKKQNSNQDPSQKSNSQKQKVFGRYDFSNGAVYEGQFNVQNQFSGNGVLYLSNGKIFYSGCWKRNQFHGFGILNNIQTHQMKQFVNININYIDFNLNGNNLWTQYEGQFFQDKKHGFGTLYFVNGDKFSGCFVNDSIQGYGNFYKKYESQTIMGIWANNIYQV